MKTVRDALLVYQELSFSDRLIFYTTLSSDMDMQKNELPEFLEEARPAFSKECCYCSSPHVVRNGHRKDGTQRFLCRDCRRTFTRKTDSLISCSHKHFGIWKKYLSCMADKKTLRESAETCGISLRTAFSWRHKILAALKKAGTGVCLEGIVEADETYYNVSYKGNHTLSRDFAMPRQSHRRGGDVNTKGLSSEKVCVACAVSKSGTAVSKAVKTGKVSTESLDLAFGNRIISGSTLCTDHEQAYIGYASAHGLPLIRMEVGRRTSGTYGIQRINAYHSRLKGFTGIFRGVSTKYLDHYLVWHDRLLGCRGTLEVRVHAIMDLCLSFGKHIRNQEFPKMSALPCAMTELNTVQKNRWKEACV